MPTAEKVSMNLGQSDEGGGQIMEGGSLRDNSRVFQYEMRNQMMKMSISCKDGFLKEVIGEQESEEESEDVADL